MDKLKLLLVSALLVPFGTLALALLIDSESRLVIFPIDFREFREIEIIVFLGSYFVFPAICGVATLIYLAVSGRRSRANGDPMALYIILAVLGLMSEIWLYPLFVIAVLYSFPFNLPL